jgi:phosphoribosylformylglycinamidine synthase subunit PurS
VVKVIVHVTPKKNVLDPQGAAVEHAMNTLGWPGARLVRVGKTIEFSLDGEADSPELRTRLDALCRDLLSNPVIEDYRYDVEPGT